MVDLLGGPAADMTAGMQEDFEQADDAGVVDLDPGISADHRRARCRPFAASYRQLDGAGMHACKNRSKPAPDFGVFGTPDRLWPRC